MSPMVSITASKVRAAALPRWAFSLEKAISIGFRSGEYCGRNSIHAPCAHDGLGLGAFADREIKGAGASRPKNRGVLASSSFLFVPWKGTIKDAELTFQHLGVGILINISWGCENVWKQ